MDQQCSLSFASPCRCTYEDGKGSWIQREEEKVGGGEEEEEKKKPALEWNNPFRRGDHKSEVIFISFALQSATIFVNVSVSWKRDFRLRYKAFNIIQDREGKTTGVA